MIPCFICAYSDFCVRDKIFVSLLSIGSRWVFVQLKLNADLNNVKCTFSVYLPLLLCSFCHMLFGYLVIRICFLDLYKTAKQKDFIYPSFKSIQIDFSSISFMLFGVYL